MTRKTEVPAGANWRNELASWAIPAEILESAPESPWIHPPAMFQIPALIEDSPSHQKARGVMPEGGSILDIGCGGGIAAFAVAPPAGLVIGVDHQPEALELFAANAVQRSLAHQTISGFWPEVADQTPRADVVTAHHVVFNVQDIEDFILAMNGHAKKRVVIEMPQHHPLMTAAHLWKHFWNLERPTSPTTVELMDVLRGLGIKANIELWQGSTRTESDIEQQAHFSRIRLCLPASREPEVLEYLKRQPKMPMRELATIWWDVT